jgi:hypothetical protein
LMEHLKMVEIYDTVALGEGFRGSLPKREHINTWTQ